jgi:hypothetical protein
MPTVPVVDDSKAAEPRKGGSLLTEGGDVRVSSSGGGDLAQTGGQIAQSALPLFGAATGAPSGTPAPVDPYADLTESAPQEADPYADLAAPSDVEPKREPLPAPDPYEAIATPTAKSPLTLDPDAPPEQPPEGFKPTPTERAVHRSTFGRVLDAFGEGFADGFGDSRVGFDDDTLKALEDAGLIGKQDGSVMSYFRSFNETFILPLANAPVAVLEGTGRAIEGSVKSAAKGAGQIALEAGADPGLAKRLTRDIVALGETVGVVTAALPPSMAARATTTNTVRKIATADKKAVEAVNKAPAAARVRAEREAVYEPFEDTPASGPSIPTPQPAPGSAGAAAAPEPGNLNLDRVNAPDDVKDVLRSIAISNGGFQDARRGVQTFEETESLASIVGITPDALAKVQKGEAFNAEELLAARQLLVASAHNVRAAAKAASGGDEAALVAYRETVLRHQSIQESVAGLTAEAGRALSALRITAGDARDAKALTAVIEANGGRADLIDQARAVAAMDDPAQVSRMLMDARKSTFGEKLLEVWINGLLSAPTTHLANVIGNTLTTLNSVAETAVAAGIGSARNVVTGGKASERVRLGEVNAELFGLLQGSGEGTRLAAKAYLTELPSDTLAKLDQKRRQAIPSIKVGKLEIGGKQVRIPGRLLMAEDELIKAMARRQKLNGTAYRIASEEGLTGQAKADRIAQLLKNPTDAMKAEADAHALTVTFQNPLGNLGNAIMNASNSHPLAKVVLPFVRTPVNILKYPLKRTPLGLFSKEVRENLAGKNGKIARDQEAARMIVGTTTATGALNLAANGYITGAGPSDPGERAMLRATGWQPHSIKIGDSYYSYARFEPLALYLGIVADAHDLMSKSDLTEEERNNIGTAIVAAFVKNANDKTFMKGIADLTQAVTDPDRYASRYLQRLAGSTVPAIVAQTARATDDTVRDTRDLGNPDALAKFAQEAINTFKSRLPGLSDDLLPRRDVWGQQITRGGALGPDILSTIYTSREKNDPVARELIAIGYFPGQLSRKIGGIELTGEEYDRYQKVAGVLTRQALAKVIQHESWSTYSVDAKAKIARDVVNATRQRARNKVILENRELQERIKANALERRRRLLGVTE